MSVALLLLSAAVAVLAVPRGFTTFFDAEKCPKGWREYEPSKGRLIVSVSDAANAGLTVGTPIADRTAPTHTHTTSLSGNLPHLHIAGAGGGDSQAAAHGDVSTTFTSNAGASNLPFTQLIMCQVTAEAATNESVALGAFAFFDPALSSCPKNWEPVHSLDGRIAVPGYDLGGGIPNAEPPLSPGEDRRHSHKNVSVKVQESQVSFVGIDSCCNNAPSRYQEYLTVSGEAHPASSNVPYTTMLTCASQQFSFNLSLPQGAIIFTLEECPPGWEISLELAGRLLASLPRNGQPGAFFGGNSFNQNGTIVDPVHHHGLAGTIDFPSCAIELAPGCCAGGYASQGSQLVLGTTTDADVNLPFTMYGACRQSAGASAAAKSANTPVRRMHRDWLNKRLHA